MDPTEAHSNNHSQIDIHRRSRHLNHSSLFALISFPSHPQSTPEQPLVSLCLMSPPPPAAPAVRSWDNMVLDLLVLVLFHLPCIADRASFASVCNHWRSAVAHLSSKEAPPAQIPWLVFPSPAIGSAVTTVFCLLSGTTHRIRLPADLAGAHLSGSHPGGWLAAAAHVPGGGNSMAANLFSGEKVPLPSEQQLSRSGAMFLTYRASRKFEYFLSYQCV